MFAGIAEELTQAAYDGTDDDWAALGLIIPGDTFFAKYGFPLTWADDSNLSEFGLYQMDSGGVVSSPFLIASSGFGQITVHCPHESDTHKPISSQPYPTP